MRTFKIYSHSYFQIWSTILLTIVAMLYIMSKWLTHFTTENLYLLILFTHFVHPTTPAAGNCRSASISISSVIFVLFLTNRYILRRNMWLFTTYNKVIVNTIIWRAPFIFKFRYTCMLQGFYLSWKITRCMAINPDNCIGLTFVFPFVWKSRNLQEV